MKTINDLWRYIDRNITNKVNDPWSECWATIFPVDTNGEFGKPISSMDVTPNADPYELVETIMRDTSVLPTNSFGFMVPGRVRDGETGEVTGMSIIMAMVSDKDMSFGMWKYPESTFEELPTDDSQGLLVDALGTLAIKWDIDHGGMGDIGVMVREAMIIADEGRALLEKAKAMLEEAYALHKG
jgi:hypothetical protein